MKRSSSQMPGIAYQVSTIQVFGIQTSTEWKPAMNVYRCEEELIVCLDLAGVDLGSVRVELDGHTLRIRGRRQAPEPDCKHYKVLQVLNLEIDYGRFQRELCLPCAVTEDALKVEHRDGYLWIDLAVPQH